MRKGWHNDLFLVCRQYEKDRRLVQTWRNQVFSLNFLNIPMKWRWIRLKYSQVSKSVSPTYVGSWIKFQVSVPILWLKYRYVTKPFLSQNNVHHATHNELWKLFKEFLFLICFYQDINSFWFGFRALSWVSAGILKNRRSNFSLKLCTHTRISRCK
jgi:hypothetical protein